jgi:hypothetical protein
MISAQIWPTQRGAWSLRVLEAIGVKAAFPVQDDPSSQTHRYAA